MDKNKYEIWVSENEFVIKSVLWGLVLAAVILSIYSIKQYYEIKDNNQILDRCKGLEQTEKAVYCCFVCDKSVGIEKYNYNSISDICMCDDMVLWQKLEIKKNEN